MIEMNENEKARLLKLLHGKSSEDKIDIVTKEGVEERYWPDLFIADWSKEITPTRHVDKWFLGVDRKSGTLSWNGQKIPTIQFTKRQEFLGLVVAISMVAYNATGTIQNLSSTYKTWFDKPPISRIVESPSPLECVLKAMRYQ